MTVTQNNVRQTLQDLSLAGTKIENIRLLVFDPNRGSAAPMSSAELEFAVKNTANAMINIHNAFLSFLQRMESDSRLHR